MARWYEEARLCQHPVEEIGAAFYIREILNNNCLINRWDLRDVFGDGFETILENLRKSGLLRIEATGTQVALKIITPGDKKRERCRSLVSKGRAIDRFERGIVGGGESAERSSAFKTARKPK